VTKKLYITCLV